MNRIHIEPVGGAAGDMLLGALIDLGADEAAIQATFEGMQTEGLALHTQRVSVGDTEALHVRSVPPGPEHVHRHLKDIHGLIDKAGLTPRADKIARRIFDILCEAEATVHGATPGSVHLHEVGELDSVMDVVGIAQAYDSLGAPTLTCAPLPSGHGKVNTQHGLLDCPVPAVAEIARCHDVPMTPVDVEGETITPTGIAALVALASEFTTADVSQAKSTGTGAGTKRFPNRLNILVAHGWR